MLEMALAVLPPNCRVILLADRGFEHGELICWLQAHRWSWAIRAKSDLKVTLANGQTRHVSDLYPRLTRRIYLATSPFSRTFNAI